MRSRLRRFTFPWIAGPVFLALLLWPGFVHADVLVTLDDNSTLTATAIEYRDGNLVLPDGRAIARDRVRKILYLKGEKGWSLSPTRPDPEEYRAFLDEGRRLAQKYPGYDHYVIQDENIFTWNPDGTNSLEVRTVHYIAKEEGKGFAAFTFSVEEERNRYVFRALRSVSGDLRVRDADPEKIVTAPMDDSTMFFQHSLEISGQVPEPEVGGLIELHTIQEEFNPFDRRQWFMQNYFRSEYPSARSSLSIRVPAGMNINTYKSNLPPELSQPRVRKTGEYVEYAWVSGETPPIVPEPSAPPLGEIVPFIAASPFFDWEYIFDLQTRLIGDHAVPDERVKKAAEEITKDASGDEEKIARIYAFLQKKIRYISVKGGVGSGWGGHPAWMTLENRFGDCIDKAILMTAMLTSCGIEAEVAVLMTNQNLQMMDKLPVLYGNHAITRVTLGGKSFYLDSTGSMLRYPSIYSHDQGVPALLPKSRRVETIPAVRPPANGRRYDYQIEMDRKGGMRISREETATGHVEAGMRGYLTGIKEKDRREGYMREAAALSPGGELASFSDEGVDDLLRPVTCRVAWTLPDYVEKSGDLLFFRLPYVESGYGQIALPERKTPLYMNSGFSTEKNYEVKLPPGFDVRLVPEPLEVRTPWYEISAAYETKGGALVYRYRYEHKFCRVPPENYAEYREGLLKAEQYERQNIFLAPSKGGGR